jgi:6-phosphogluconolactonase
LKFQAFYHSGQQQRPKCHLFQKDAPIQLDRYFGGIMASRLFVLLSMLLLFIGLVGCGDNNNNSNSNNTGTNAGGTPNTGGSNPGNTGGGGAATTAEYIYATNAAANDQSSFTLYSLDSSTGAVTQKSTTTIPVRASLQIATDSTGTNAFVVGFEAPSPNMDIVKVDLGAGTISPFPGQMFHSVTTNEGDCCPSAIAVDPSGTTAYVGGLNDGAIHFFQVSTSTGAWNEVATYSEEFAHVYAVAIDPSGKYLYSSQRGASAVGAWSRDSSGKLTPLPGAPFDTAGLTSTVSISPDGKFLFVPHYELSSLEVFRINSDGTISQVQANIRAGNAPFLAVTDPQERFLYVSNSGTYNAEQPTISAYKFDASTGAATPIAGSPFNSPQATTIVVDPSGKYLFPTGSAVTEFSIDQTTGALTQMPNSLPAATDIKVVKH